MIFYKKLLLAAAATIIPFLVTAQHKENRPERIASFSASVNVFPMLNDIYRLDIEGKKTKSYLSHVFSTELINGFTKDGSDRLFNENPDKISGWGLGIHQKWVAKKGAKGNFPYISYGALIRDISIAYDGVGFTSYQENSLDYYRYGPFSDQLKIKGTVYDLIAGVQFINSHLLFDCYFGVAYKKSSSRSNYSGFREYNGDYSSFAYKGWAPQIGAKIGIKLF